MAARSLLILPALCLMGVACKKTVPAAAAVEKADVHPDLVCEDPAYEAGKAPPLGTWVWCQVEKAPGLHDRHGPAIHFYENGLKSESGNFIYGHKDGMWTGWYATGQARYEGAWSLGVQSGYWVEYHDTGRKKSAGQIVNGKPDGPWTYWNEAGQKESEGNWLRGQRTGLWSTYDAAGKLSAERVWREGRLVSHREIK